MDTMDTPTSPALASPAASGLQSRFAAALLGAMESGEMLHGTGLDADDAQALAALLVRTATSNPDLLARVLVQASDEVLVAAGPSSGDAEIDAMRRVAVSLEPLASSARHRVVAWAASRFGISRSA